MTNPSQPAVLHLERHTVCPLIQFLISELVGPVDISDLTEATVMKDIDLSYISFR